MRSPAISIVLACATTMLYNATLFLRTSARNASLNDESPAGGPGGAVFAGAATKGCDAGGGAIFGAGLGGGPERTAPRTSAARAGAGAPAIRSSIDTSLRRWIQRSS